MLKLEMGAQATPVFTPFHLSLTEEQKQHVSGLHQTQWSFGMFATIHLHLVGKIQAIPWVN